MISLPEVSKCMALHYEYFPTVWQTVLFRNWGHVQISRLADILKTDVPTLRKEAGNLGLNSEIVTNFRWLKRGYLTIIRGNWHLLSFEQIAFLLDISIDYLAFILKEDDFFWDKMGELKPIVPSVKYSPLTDEQQKKTQCIFNTINQAFPKGIKDNAFDFINEFLIPVNKPCNKYINISEEKSKHIRMVYSYCALYGDPLMNPESDPFPDALLQKYYESGVNGIWMQGVLYQLVEFPFDTALSHGYKIRIASLQKLIKRAAVYGIGVYLYLNEPRSMSSSFFEKYPYMRGKKEGNFYAMCTSVTEVKNYLEDAVFRLFSSAPGLAGFITITMSENLTNCYSREGDGVPCPRCNNRKPQEIIAEVNNLMARGARRANPKAKAIVWTWGWQDDWANLVSPLLTEGQIIQCTSEEALTYKISGRTGSVLDYSLSLCGPGEKAKLLWQQAKSDHHQTCAKTQFNNSWELAAIPWIPVMDKVAQHISNLKAENICHYNMSWTLGGYPSPNLKLAAFLSDNKGNVHDFLTDWLGTEAGIIADKGQKILSKAFSEFPFDLKTLYKGPQNFGPMAPFFLKPTGWTATMIGFPYDDLDNWRSIYSREEYYIQFKKLTTIWRKGIAYLQEGEKSSPDFDELLLMSRGALCHFESTLNHIAFIIARDNNDIDRMIEIISLEYENVKLAIYLRKKDSRIGYEASNHYFYSMNDLGEKLINLNHIMIILKDRKHNT